MPARRALFDRWTLGFVLLSVALVWVRIVALRLSPLDLHFDEAQYWAWSQSFELGYFSKPPLIAWVIAATTALVGDAEWGVRLAAPIAHGLGALALYALGRNLYGAAAGFWAGLTWLLLPAVSLSSFVMSTDALVLPLWSFALLALWRLVATRSWFWAVLLGVAVGAGALAKYAMLYFPLCALLATWWAKPVREALLGPRGIVAALIALAILSPNLYWNFTHGFETVAHTASNASLTSDLFHPGEMLEFALNQGLVIGPIFLVLFVWLLSRAARHGSTLQDADRFLLAFVIPPLAVILVQAFLSRANANWAAAAYPAAVVWLCGNLIATKAMRRWLAGATFANVLLGALFISTTVDPAIPSQVVTAFNNLTGLHVRTPRGQREATHWEETAREIAIRARGEPGEAPFTAVLVDHRAAYFELAYYWRHARRSGAPLPPVRMWLLTDAARNSAEAGDPMRPEEGARVLVVHMTPKYLPLVAGDFTVFRAVEHLSVPLDGGATRELDISVGESFAPAVRDEAYLLRVRELN
ncbi:MAG: glycosyltransferase family 39 protein [Terricaulis sp.]